MAARRYPRGAYILGVAFTVWYPDGRPAGVSTFGSRSWPAGSSRAGAVRPGNLQTVPSNIETDIRTVDESGALDIGEETARADSRADLLPWLLRSTPKLRQDADARRSTRFLQAVGSGVI